jgi:hypothetical protein
VPDRPHRHRRRDRPRPPAYDPGPYPVGDWLVFPADPPAGLGGRAGVRVLATVNVRCTGKIHPVVLLETGELVTPAHSANAELALRTLGGRKPRCQKVVAGWKRYIRSGDDADKNRNLPDKLIPFVEAARNTNQTRASRKGRRGRHEDALFTIPEAPGRFDPKNQSGYRQSSGIILGAQALRVAVMRALAKDFGPDWCVHPEAGYGYVEPRNAKVDVWTRSEPITVGGRYRQCVTARAIVPKDWFTDVYRNGLALVAGHLCLAVLTPADERASTPRWRVLLARPAVPLENRYWHRADREDPPVAYAPAPARVDRGRHLLFWE